MIFTFLEFQIKNYDIYSYGTESDGNKVMIRTDTTFQDEARYNFPASILFKRIDELDSLDLDILKLLR
jgi:hypothetical protein